MNFLIYLAITAGIWAIDHWVMPALNKQQQPQPVGIGDISIPRAIKGAVVPVFFGRIKVTGANLDWVGQLQSAPDPYNPGAFLYALAMRLHFGIPVGDFASLGAFFVNNQPYDAPFNGTTNKDALVISGCYFYGGSLTDIPTFNDDVSVYGFITSWGSVLQVVAQNGTDSNDFSPLLGSAWIALYSPITAVGDPGGPLQNYGGFILGNNPTPPPFSAELVAMADKWLDPTIRGIGPGDCNPATVMYDLMTKKFARGGIDPALIDKTSFVAAAATLQAEGHGMSGVIYTDETLDTALQKIERQINGVRYQDPQTGLWTLKLARADYTLTSLMEISDAAGNVLDGGVQQFATQSWSDTYNAIHVRFTARDLDYNQDTADDQDGANFYMQNQRPRALTVDYPWICDRALAQTIAARELRAVSRPLRTIKVVTDRSTYQLRPGGLFKFSWSRFVGVTDVVFRIGTMDFGQLMDGRITITAIEDVFAVDQSGFGIPPVQIAQFNLATPIVERIVDECPRWLQRFGVDAGRIASADDPHAWYLAVPPTNDVFVQGQISADGVTFVGDGGHTSFPATGVLTGSYSRAAEPYDTTTGFTIGTVTGKVPQTLNATAIYTVAQQVSILGGNLLRVDNEIMAAETIVDNGDGTFTLSNIWRGLLDTVPVAHAAGAELYFITSGDLTILLFFSLFDVNQIGIQKLLVGQALTARTLPFDRHNHQLAPPTDQQTDALVVRGRAVMPYPCANLLVQAAKAPAALTVDVVSIASSPRDYLSSTITRGDAGAEGPTLTSVDVNAKRKGLDPLPRVTVGAASISSGAAAGVQLAQAGHGTIGVSTRAHNGALHSWQDPEIDIIAPHWRSLLANGDFSGGLASWTTDSGTPAVTSSVGPGGNCAALSATVTGDTIIHQQINVAGYRADGLTAYLSLFGNSNAGSGAPGVDTVVVTIAAYDVNGTHLGSDTTSTTVPPTTPWSRIDLLYTTLPAGTAQARATIKLHASTSGPPATRVALVEFRIGQPSAQLLTNGGFESGTTGSWTVASGTFSVQTTAPFEGADYLLCTVAGEIRQDVTVTAGWELGSTAVLEFARGQDNNIGSGANWLGEVKLQALDGSNVVLATSTTGAESISAGNNTYLPRLLSLDLPIGTVKVRVDYVVTTGTNHRAIADGFYLRIWKHLEIDALLDNTYATPSVQTSPTTEREWEIAFPTISLPGYVYDGTSIRWKQGDFDLASVGTHLAFDAKCVGPIAADGATSISCLEFPSGSAGIEALIASSDTSKLNFTAATPFTVIVQLRLDGEENVGVTKSIVGRMSGGSVGWGLDLDAGSQAAVATFGGSIGLGNAHGNVAITDGGFHQIALVYDPVAHLMHCIDENGTDHTVSTAALGEIAVDGQYFAIGARGVLPGIRGQVARVYIWNAEALSAAEIAAIWNHAKDTTGSFSAGAQSDVWALPYPDDVGGAVISRFSIGQFGLGYDAANGNADAGYSLVTQAAITNLMPTMDFKDGAWGQGAGAQITFDQLGPDGFLSAAKIHHTGGGGTTDYFEIGSIALGAGNPTVAWYWRNPAGLNTSVKVELVNNSGVVKDTYTFSLGTVTTWQRSSHVFTWDNSTPNARLRFYSASAGTTLDLLLSPTIGVYQLATGTGTITPIGIPCAAYAGSTGSASASYEIVTAAPTLQHNSEGELLVTARMTDTTRVGGTLVNVRNASNSNDRRQLFVGVVGTPSIRLAHYDGAASASFAAISVADFAADYHTHRGRWSRAALLEDPSHFASLVSTAGATANARAAIWTPGAAAVTRIDIGHANGSDLMTAFVRRVRLSAREIPTPAYAYSDVGAPGSGVAGGALA